MYPGGFPPVSMLSEHEKNHSFDDGAFTYPGDLHTGGACCSGSTGKP
jgi:hypothetical protein